MATDNFSKVYPSLDGPVLKSLAVATANTEFSTLPRAIFVGTGGDLVMQLSEDSVETTWKNIANGTFLYVRPLKITTASTANNIILIL